MAKTLNKMEPKQPVAKMETVKKVRGYVAPTDTGTIRTVRAHEKLVKVDVKDKKTGSPSDIPKLKGTLTHKEAADKLRGLSANIKNADFGKSTKSLTQSTVNFYRGGVNTSSNAKLDTPDGLRKVFDELQQSLLSVGFKNKYSLTAQEAMAKITSPSYVKELMNKVTAVHKRMKELGLDAERLDLFTIAINDAEGKQNRIYVSNNPLDFITADTIGKGKITEKNGNILASFHQNEMNDFVFYTANNLKGGTKTAAAVASYDPNAKKFNHYPNIVGKASAITSMLTNKLKSSMPTNHYHTHTIADREAFEIKAMVTEKLKSLQQEIEEEVKDTGKGESMDGVLSSDYITQYFGDIFEKSLKGPNAEFTNFAAKANPRSLAKGSPLNGALQDVAEAGRHVSSAIHDAVSEYRVKWNRKKLGK